MKTETCTRLKNRFTDITNALIWLSSQAILSLPLAFIVMLAGAILLLPLAIKSDHFTWSQTLMQFHAMHLPLMVLMYHIAHALRMYLYGAWIIALIARLISNSFSLENWRRDFLASTGDGVGYGGSPVTEEKLLKQARSLGVSVTLGSCDVQGLKKVNTD